MASGEWRIENKHPLSIFSLLLPYSLFATPYSPFRHSLLPIRYSSQHSSANQRFHVPDILPADLVGDRADAGGARHRVPAEKQMIAGADQAGVEQHRIDGAELAGLDAFGQQAAMKIQQWRDEEFRDFVGGLRAAFMQQIMD